MENPKQSETVPKAVSFAALCRNLGVVQQIVLDTENDIESYYETFERPKKRGGSRKISASTGRLKNLQQKLLKGLLSKIAMPPHVHGCVKERSVVTNAQVHVGQETVINIDLKNFFGTINSDTVQSLLRKHCLLDEGCSKIFAKLCTHKNFLPQGAPTSPVLANFAALEMDKKIQELLASKYAYSRHVDDLTISGAKDVVSMVPQIYQIIENSGFVVNVEKTRILRQSVRQSVTGIVVNKKLNPSKRLVRFVRQNLYYCKRFGLTEHCESIDMRPDIFIRKMHECIGYIRMTNPVEADRFVLLFKEILPQNEQSEEEKNIRLLKHAIDCERMVSFKYERSYRKAAPASIFVDDEEDTIHVKAYQFEPEQLWTTYRLALMTKMEVQFNRLA